mgnify:CR=1 FL=1
MKKTLAIILLLTTITGTVKSACTDDENGNTGVCDVALDIHPDGSYTMSLVCRKRTEAEKADNVANDCVLPKKKAELGPGF